MNILKTFVLHITVVLISIPLHGQEERNDFSLANQMFENAEFRKAIVEYEGLVEKGFSNSELLHNLGLSYYKTGALAKAILNLERALKLDPNNAHIRHNLELINEEIETDILNAEPFFLKVWYVRFVSSIHMGIWLILSAVFLIAFLILLYLRLIKSVNLFKHYSYFNALLIVCISLSLVLNVFAFSNQWLKNHSGEVIVMEDNVVLRMGAEENAAQLMIVSQGLKLLVLDQINEYLKVRLPDLTEAWVNETYVEYIKKRP